MIGLLLSYMTNPVLLFVASADSVPLSPVSSRPSPNARVSWTVGLHRADTASLYSEFNTRTQPGSPTYGKWLSIAEVTALVSSAAGTAGAATRALAAAGATCLLSGPSSLRCTANASVAELLYGSSVFSHLDSVAGDGMFTEAKEGSGGSNRRVLNDLPQPSVLAGSASFAAGFLNLDASTASSFSRNVETHRGGGLRLLRALQDVSGATPYAIPATIANLYQTAGAGVSSRDVMNASVAAVGFLDAACPQTADLDAFADAVGVARFSPIVAGGPGMCASRGDVLRSESASAATSELLMQTELMGGLLSGTDATVFAWDMGPDPAAWIFEFTESVLTAAKAGAPYARVYALGLSSPESGGAAYSDAYMNAADEGLAALALLGVTVIAGAGNFGASGAAPGCEPGSTVIVPAWPATSPFVLSVGATQLSVNSSDSFPDSIVRAVCALHACASGVVGVGGEVPLTKTSGAAATTGGGFSARYPRPEWQATAINAWATRDFTSTLYNTKMRAFPDVSAIGRNIISAKVGDGTEASTAFSAHDGTAGAVAVWASFIGLANGMRARSGLPTLGHVNAALYALADSLPNVFNDVTFGDNNCSHSDCGGCGGFAARAFWDPASGLGTPNTDLFNELAKPASQTPSPTRSPIMTPSPSPSVSRSARPPPTTRPAAAGFEFAAFNDTTTLVFSGDARSSSCDDGGPYVYSSMHAVDGRVAPDDDGRIVVEETASIRRVTAAKSLSPRDASEATRLSGFPHRDDFSASSDARNASCPTRLRLTPSRPYKVGVAAHERPLPALDAWESGFTFQLTDPSRACSEVKDASFGTASHRTCSVAGGDGLAFIVHADVRGARAIGEGGGGMGYAGVRGALAVQFDSWYNGDDGDVPFDHMSVHASGAGGGGGNGGGDFSARAVSADVRTNIGGALRRLNIADGLVHAVRVAYVPYIKLDWVPYFSASESLRELIGAGRDATPIGTLAVWFDAGGSGNTTGCGDGTCAGEAPRVAASAPPILALPIELSRVLQRDGGDAWFALTAATGATAWQKHDILSWYWCGAKCGAADNAGDTRLSPASVLSQQA